MRECRICGRQFANRKHPEAMACSKVCAGALSWRNRVAKGERPGRNHPITACVICRKQTRSETYNPRKTCGTKKCRQECRLRSGWLEHVKASRIAMPTYKGGVIQKGNYLLQRMPDHPNADKKGYVMQHRLVVEGHIGRLLESFEKVHHRNGVKTDNRIKNLEIVTHARPNGVVICPHCRRSFEVH